MVTPHTTGVAALYLQANPTASPAAVRTALYDATTKGIVKNSNTANNHLLYGLVAAPPYVEPTASFTYTCTNPACTFADASTGSITGWSWDFGDNTQIATVQNPAHTYAAAGMYTVQLTVTDTVGATSTATTTVAIHGADIRDADQGTS